MKISSSSMNFLHTIKKKENPKRCQRTVGLVILSVGWFLANDGASKTLTGGFTRKRKVKCMPE